MTDIKRYTPEFIFKYKDNNILTDSLKSYLDNVKEYMISGTDSKDFKIKIQKGDIKLTSTKWYRKRFVTQDEKIKKNINSLLNRLTEKNYRDVTKKLMHLDINSLEIVMYLIDNIIEKCLLECHYLPKWSFLLKHVIFFNLNKWTFKGNFLYIIFLDKCQKYVEDLLNSDHHNQLVELYNGNIDEFYKKKNYATSLMMLISEIYKLDLISKNTITGIVANLLKDQDKFYKLELSLVIIKYLYDQELGEELYNKYVAHLTKDNNLNKKIKFMILDIEDEFLKNKKVNNDKKVIYKEEENDYEDRDVEVEAKVKNLINEYISENDLEYTITCYNEIEVKPRSNKIIYEFLLNLLESDSVRYNHIFGLLKKLIRRKLIKYNNIKFGFIDFLKEYDDLKLDYPNLEKSVIKLFNIFIRIKVFDFNTIKFILNKSVNEDMYNKFINGIQIKKK